MGAGAHSLPPGQGAQGHGPAPSHSHSTPQGHPWQGMWCRRLGLRLGAPSETPANCPDQAQRWMSKSTKPCPNAVWPWTCRH